MGAVAGQQIGLAFEKANHVKYQGIGQSAYELGHLLQQQADARQCLGLSQAPLDRNCHQKRKRFLL
jgi:hypothetical protein